MVHGHASFIVSLDVPASSSSALRFLGGLGWPPSRLSDLGDSEASSVWVFSGVEVG